MSELRQLTPADQPALEAFLNTHPAETMFLRSNLARSGLAKGDGPYHGRYAAAFEDGAIAGVAALYWNGMLVIHAPRHAAMLAAHFAGTPGPAGVIGPWQQALDAQEALGRHTARLKLRSREILMTLSLDKLQVPAPMLSNQALTCRLATEADLPLLRQWRHDFSCETLGATPSQDLNRTVETDVTRWVVEKSQFILQDGERPVAGCSFNARLPDAVQIGNVWTPPDWRSRGYARMVVAGALRQARQDGATQAILFTPEDNTAAKTAYAAVGFTPVGDYAILLFAD